MSKRTWRDAGAHAIRVINCVEMAARQALAISGGGFLVFLQVVWITLQSKPIKAV